MSKYSPETLKAMAKSLLKLKKNNDSNYFQFVMTMCIKTNVHPHIIEQRIEYYADARP